MEKLQYLPAVNRRKHIITLKDIFAYYDVTKVKGKGNLRITYGRKDKRDLVISIFNVYIAEMFDEFVQGGFVFNFPDKNNCKMLFMQVPSNIVKLGKAQGKLKYLDPVATNFLGIKTVLRLASKNAYYDTNVFVSENFQKIIYDKLNNKQNLLGKTDKFYDDFMETIYNSYSDIDKSSLKDIVLFGLRKMIFFANKGLELFLQNSRGDEYFYIGRQINKHKNIPLRYKIMTRQYIKKLRWHYQAQKIKNTDRYYAINEESYNKHKAGELLDVVALKKIKEECLVGQPWYKYVFKTTNNTKQYFELVNNYDSSNDELIFIKPQNEKTNFEFV